MEKVNIAYTKARFHKRCFGNLIDFLLFALFFGLFFLGSRGIVTSTPGYVGNEESLMSIRDESGLYSVKGSVSTDWVEELENGTYSSYVKVLKMDEAVTTFIAYLNNISEDSSKKVQDDYDSFRLSFVYEKGSEKHPYFNRKEDGTISRNTYLIENGYVTNQMYFDEVYVPFYDEHALGYLVTLVPDYLDLVRFESIMLFAIELPISWLFSGVLVYLVPGLFWKRGRMSFGKWTYRIGLADKNLLSPSLGTHFARWAIFFFGELTLSIFTFGIPCIVSFSLMAFSKNKQGFPDYILRLVEVDTSNAKLYYSFDEILLTGVGESKKPIDFTPTYED